jgi:excinuclease ABC subunit A
VGLGYLTLDRSAPTLSGGEAQRIRLAAQLGSNLRGVCYILDEPTIGLHHRDNRILLDVLEKLEAKGNSLVVVEHDEDTIRRAHHVIDLGPGAGKLGGQLIAEGTAADLMRHAGLADRPLPQVAAAASVQPRRRRVARTAVHRGAEGEAPQPEGNRRAHPARAVDGGHRACRARASRRSPRDVLYNSLKEKHLHRVQGDHRLESRSSACWKSTRRRSARPPRSCPATYVGSGTRSGGSSPTRARRACAAGPLAASPFNTAGGRCEACEGQGIKKIEMSFLPDVRVTCEGCGGARFNPETLQVRLRGRTAGEALAMSVDEALEFFAAHPSIKALPAAPAGRRPRLPHARTAEPDAFRRRGPAHQAGLRASKTNATKTLYVLDEPTVGLHMADVEKADPRACTASSTPATPRS